MSPTLSPSQKRPHKDEPGSPKRQRLGFYSPQFRAVEIDDLDTLLAESDFMSVHLPRTPV